MPECRLVTPGWQINDTAFKEIQVLVLSSLPCECKISVKMDLGTVGWKYGVGCGSWTNLGKTPKSGITVDMALGKPGFLSLTCLPMTDQVT